ncbi:MAG: hypothetical protein DSY80_07005 [Desulfocapsa sp.]|nr:MAG: hypothetical protein DSY80_07005 [Desulfocapsa sp.]
MPNKVADWTDDIDLMDVLGVATMHLQEQRNPDGTTTINTYHKAGDTGAYIEIPVYATISTEIIPEGVRIHLQAPALHRTIYMHRDVSVNEMRSAEHANPIIGTADALESIFKRTFEKALATHESGMITYE